ncbi:PF07045 domain protein [Bordetella holmesii CDC-H635-BH]|uniref:PF07045 domain protein n=1 Tax=Bordetella holmesii CDC-H585-BH TaxID=1331206 RepID=A0A158M3C6_9BORD|nr:PF07045 domain protein [Bordetella holmesii CDC-H809-BH]KAK84908.1 PF07045 domain protein [Bordetella holmesii CDC-H572-BH]KAK90214.1 PF07045 domain protein [Bordetella holmesii CDC-H585-BH]KAL01559.1 PF07045 domain protein [Bordetella holmesii CDC-H635-BH]KCV00887.1 PF07045 domain protein [Bordetella holmesii CDC-H719-BH]KCV07070.1 PF07045 domain protein [Bordetella holmesii CDC-H785-BH]KCV12567.1 PF07045 domain protein [Bordetella holmesii 04P3421]
MKTTNVCPRSRCARTTPKCSCGAAKLSTLRGEPGRTVVLEFPTMAAAQAFYDSWQYRRARNAREGAAVMNMFIVQGM